MARKQADTTPLQPELLDYLESEIRERGWTFAELSRRSGVAHSHFSQLKSGRSGLGKDTLPRLADCLGVSVEFLLRLGGYIAEPAIDENEAYWKELRNVVADLTPADKRRFLEIARSLRQSVERPSGRNRISGFAASKPQSA